MQNQGEQIIYAEFMNAFLQGYFDKQLLEESELLTGIGITIDDEFNFFMSQYSENKLEGASFLRMSKGHIICGQFKENRPSGVIVVTKGEYTIYLSVHPQRRTNLYWRKEAVVINTQTNLFYVLQLQEKKQRTVEQDQNHKIAQIFHAQRKCQWKIRILDRCFLKTDGNLAGYSKLINSLQKPKLSQFKKNNFSLQQQNFIHLVSSVLGNNFKDPYIISPYSFLIYFSLKNPKISVAQMKDQQSKEQILYLTMKNYEFQRPKANKKILGLLMRLNSYSPLAIGHFDYQMNLNGFGVHFSRHGYNIGVFKQNLMTKEYSCAEGTHKETNAYQLRQLLSQQHLKAINYLHHCHFVPEVSEIVSITNKVIKYVAAFQKQYEKRHLSYNDTLVQNSVSSEYVNAMKYVEYESRNKKSQDEIKNDQSELDVTWRSMRKPGFIASRQRQGQNSPIPTKRLSPHSKSPLRQVRILGKISSRSPSERKTSVLKQNASTIKRGEY